MANASLSIGTAAVTMAFRDLVEHMEARGVLNDGEFGAALYNGADGYGPALAGQLKQLAKLLGHDQCSQRQRKQWSEEPSERELGGVQVRDFGAQF